MSRRPRKENEERSGPGVVVIGDGSAGQTILVDADTGMRVDFSAETPKLGEVLDTDIRRYAAAVIIVEHTLAIFEYSEDNGYTSNMAKVIVAVKRWCARLDEDRKRIEKEKENVASFLFTASWLGMRVSLENKSPHASCNLMIGSLLDKDSRTALKNVTANAFLSAEIVLRKGEDVGPQLDEVFRLLGGPDGPDLIDREVERWRTELADS